MDDSLSASQDYNLWVLLHQARDVIYKAKEKELRQYGLSPIKAAVLFVIKAIGDKATPAEIARWVFREPNSITELINRMAGKGLVRKTRDPDKKNLVRVTLTEKGQLRSLLEKLRNRGCEELGVDYRVPFPPSL